MRPITKNEMARIAENLSRRGAGLVQTRYIVGIDSEAPDILRLDFSDGAGYVGLEIREGEDYSKAMNTAQRISQLIYHTQHLSEKMTERDKALVKAAEKKDWEDIDIYAAESKEGKKRLREIRSWKYHRDEFRHGIN